MRLLFYDRISALVPGESISGTKTFCLSEEYLRRHFSKEPLIPGVIFIEAMAQLLGWLVIRTHDFRLSAVMSLVEDVKVAPDLQAWFFGRNLRAPCFHLAQRFAWFCPDDG